MYVDLDEEKLKGKMTETIINNGIDEYLSRNFNSVVKPAINKKSLSDGQTIDRNEAIQKVRARIRQQYFN